MSKHFFAGIDGTSRSTKPRTQGRTMVIDWGLGPNAQEDLLNTAAEYVDFAKVAVGISRLLPNDVLSEKISRYQESGVEPFPGGQFLEYAHGQGCHDAYFPGVVQAAFRWVEVSDNLASVGLAWKQEMITRARREFGLRVLGEIGKKEGLSKVVGMVDDALGCLEAGAEIVLVEAAELVDEDARAEVDQLVEAVGVERVMFELPGPWIPGVQHWEIHRLRVDLMRRHGFEVNLGNVSPSEVVAVEAFRRGLGVNAGSGMG